MKILFFDIDGTLSDEATGEIPESCRLALKEAQKNGHLSSPKMRLFDEIIPQMRGLVVVLQPQAFAH